jgi:hypothetical protein
VVGEPFRQERRLILEDRADGKRLHVGYPRYRGAMRAGFRSVCWCRIGALKRHDRDGQSGLAAPLSLTQQVSLNRRRANNDLGVPVRQSCPWLAFRPSGLPSPDITYLIPIFA